MSSSTSTYSAEQLDAYLKRICFPRDRYGSITPQQARSPDGLLYLAALQKHHLAHVPFENLNLHYSPHRSVTIDQDDLFEKIVLRNRGGYCMEVNLILATILRTIGFEVVTVGARVNAGWSHQVSLIGLGEDVYMVDVGFGSKNPTRPLRLVSGEVSKWGNTDAEVRLTLQKPVASFVAGTWFYEHRVTPSHDWSRLYSFNAIEFLPEDFQILSFAVYSRSQSFFTYKLICQKAVLDDEANEICGSLVLLDQTLKRRIQDKSEIIAEFTTEDERIAALEQHFKITFTEKEKASIKGTVTAIPLNPFAI